MPAPADASRCADACIVLMPAPADASRCPDASTMLIPPSAPLGLLSSQAELLVADATTTLTVSGNGDVLEPHDGVMAIGEA